MRAKWICSAALVLVLACPVSNDGTEDASTGDATVADSAATDQRSTDLRRDDVVTTTDGGVGGDSLIGMIRLSQRYHAGTYYLDANATLSNDPILHYLSEVQFEIVQSAGDCQLRSRTAGFCEPPCDASQYCAAADECLPLPQHTSAGELSFTGVAQVVSLLPEQFRYSDYVSTDTAALIEPGAVVTVRAAGDVLPAFVVAATGVENLEFDWEREYIALDDQDLQLTWTPGTRGDVIELIFTPWLHFVAVDLHIRCVTTDSGALTIPWQLLQHIPYDYLCGGMACSPISSFTRYSEAEAQLPQGRVKFRVESRWQLQTSRR